MTLILIAIILGSVCLDQLTKWLAVIYLQGEPSFPLWPDVLHFTFVKNEGAAFGILSGHRWVFMLISTVAIVALTIYLFRFCKLNGWVKVSLAMIIGGGIGNMIDRVMLGYVIDFIDFTLIDFAVFNVADSFVTVGAGILIVYLIVSEIRELRAAKNRKPEGEAEAVPNGAGEANGSAAGDGRASVLGVSGDGVRNEEAEATNAEDETDQRHSGGGDPGTTPAPPEDTAASNGAPGQDDDVPR